MSTLEMILATIVALFVIYFNLVDRRTKLLREGWLLLQEGIRLSEEELSLCEADLASTRAELHKYMRRMENGKVRTYN